MTQPRFDPVLEQIRKLAADQQTAQLSDGELLERFAARRDEVAFEMLVRRHGPMVMRLCRRLLHHWQDAEDVFQATFLVLARKASTIRKRESVSSWLHGVAYRLAAKVRARARQTTPPTLRPGEEPARDLAADLSWKEVRAVLDEELHRLPAKYRPPLLLHYLEGLTQEETARRLGCSLSTLKRRLERGREFLRGRLTRRGVVPAAPLVLALLAEGLAPAGVPPALRDATVRAAVVFAAGGQAAGVISAPVGLLAGGLLKAMFQTKLKIITALLLTVGVTGAGVVWLLRPAEASAPVEKAEAVTAPDDQPPEVYALLRLEREERRLVNGSHPAQREEDFALTRRTQAAIIKSRAVLGAALRQPAVAKLPLVRQQRDPLRWLERALKVDSPNNAALLRVGMNGYQPDETAAVVNAVVEVYMDDFRKRDAERKLLRLKELDDVYHRRQERVKERQDVLISLGKALRNPDVNDPTAPMRQQVIIQEILDCQRELRRVRLEETSFRVQVERMQGDQSSLKRQLAIRVEQEKLLREEEKHLWSQLRELVATNEDKRDIQQVQGEIDEAKQFLKRLGDEREQLRIDLNRSRDRITLLQKAEAPKVK